MSVPRTFVVRARCALAPDGRWAEGGGVLVCGGRIERFLDTSAAVRRTGAPIEDCGDALLLPGFVAAHTHLDLAGFHRRVPAGRAFPEWIRTLLAVRASIDPDTLAAATRASAERLLAQGTTCVGDIDASGRLASVADGLRLRVRRYREVLDAGDAQRCAESLRGLDAAPRRDPLWSEGISPHAPYTVSSSLWAAVGTRARRRRLPVAIHWAETTEERAWLERGDGPFRGLLAHAPLRSGLDAIDAAGMLGPRTALIHGNDATPAERERVARSGAVLVHCPGTHAFFGRAPFDAAGWRAAGVPLALGTDSLASNDDLDMAREMALFRAQHPEFSPLEVLELATRAGARALGHTGRVGTLAAGARADLVVHDAEGRDAEERVDALTHGRTSVIAVWVEGKRVQARPGTDSPTSRIGKPRVRSQNGGSPPAP